MLRSWFCSTHWCFFRGILFYATQSVERDTWMDQKNEIVAQQAAAIGNSVHELVKENYNKVFWVGFPAT